MRGLMIGMCVLTAVFVIGCTREKDRLDAEVKRLCAIDGGIKVYETVTLPPEKFNQYGQPKIPQGGKDDTAFGYYISGEDKHLAGALKGQIGAKLYRSETRIVRTADGKVLGTETIYYRSGGELTEGLVMWPGFSCPEGESWNFIKRVLKPGEVK